MSCTKCNEPIISLCDKTPCIEPQRCDCPIVNLQTKCVVYEGDDLVCSGIKKGTILTELIIQLDTFICKVKTDLINAFQIVNIGSGAKVFKGIDLLGRKELRTVKTDDNLVVVTENISDIGVKINPTTLTSFINNLIPSPQTIPNITASNVGTGLGLIFRDKVANVLNFRKIKTVNTGTGESILNVEATVGDDVVISAKKIKTENLGEGESILNIEKTVGNDVIISAKKINSNNLNIIPSLDGNTININIPDSFQGTGYYVNGNYSGVELGTQSKPFITVTKCIDKILNRGSQNDGGLVKNKWDNLSLTKVYIQSYQTHNENLAINNVIWFLDGFDKNASLVTSNNLEYNFDMQELVNNCPKTAGQLNYYLKCYLEGNGNLQNNSLNRKGYVNAIGFSDGVTFNQPESVFSLGKEGSNINMYMIQKLSLGYVPLTDRLNNPIIRENIAMKGLLDTTVPQFGALSIKGQNRPYGNSLFLAGKLSINCYEQPLMYFDNGTAYSENVDIFYKKDYQNINFSEVRLLNTNTGNSSLDLVSGNNVVDKNGNSVVDSGFFSNTKTAKKYYPSKKVSELYLKNNSSLTMSGNFYTQTNVFASEGGSEAFVTVVRNSVVNLLGLNIVNLLFNHFIKLVNSPNQNTQDTGNQFSYSSCSINMGNFNSQCYEELISCEEQDLNDNILVNNTRAYYSIDLKDCTLNNKNYNIFRKLSNLILNIRLFIEGNPIKITNTFLFPQIPLFSIDLPKGAQYIDETGSVKIVI